MTELAGLSRPLTRRQLLRAASLAPLAALLPGLTGWPAAISPRATAHQDLVLARFEVQPFLDLLFTHAIEGMYSVPEYGGNAA